MGIIKAIKKIFKNDKKEAVVETPISTPIEELIKLGIKPLKEKEKGVEAKIEAVGSSTEQQKEEAVVEFKKATIILTEKEEKEIIELYLNTNHNSNTLAKKYNCSCDTIIKVLKYNNINMNCGGNKRRKQQKKTHKNMFTEQQEKEIIELYLNNNYSLRMLGNEFNCSHEKIRNVLKKNNIKMDKTKKRKQQKEEAVVDEEEEKLRKKVVKYYNEEKTIKFIANKCNITRRRVKEILKEEGELKEEYKQHITLDKYGNIKKLYYK